MNCERVNPVIKNEWDKCMEISRHASTSTVRIYNLIRAVGRGELTADNALHQMIEEYHNLKVISKEASTLAGDIERIIEAALADPVQKDEAKWKLGAEYEYAYCSHCGHQQWASWDSSRQAEKSIGEFHKIYKFCPNCGFKMIGATDER